jgi:hypothetical protein
MMHKKKTLLIFNPAKLGETLFEEADKEGNKVCASFNDEDFWTFNS